MKKTAQCNMFQLLAKNVHLLSIPSKLIRGGSGFALIQLFKKSMYRLFHTFLMTLTIFVIECVRIIYGLNNQLEYDLFIFCWKWNVISNIFFQVRIFKYSQIFKTYYDKIDNSRLFGRFEGNWHQNGIFTNIQGDSTARMIKNLGSKCTKK